MYPRNFGREVSVRWPSLHSLEGGKGIRCHNPVGERVCYIFLAGNRAMHLCKTAFFLAANHARNGVAIVVAFKNVFTLGTFFQVFHSIRIL